MRVVIPRYSLTFEPWQKWSKGKNPDWWTSYNNVKHKRHLHFAEANQSNAFQSVSGLFCLLAYLYHEELVNESLNPWPKLLDIERRPNDVFPEDRYYLPDFNRNEW
jgi:hypothetical protein